MQIGQAIRPPAHGSVLSAQSVDQIEPTGHHSSENMSNSGFPRYLHDILDITGSIDQRLAGRHSISRHRLLQIGVGPAAIRSHYMIDIHPFRTSGPQYPARKVDRRVGFGPK
jgi:hypothetical protein